MPDVECARACNVKHFDSRCVRLLAFAAHRELHEEHQKENPHFTRIESGNSALSQAKKP
jgi:hypothetical protein